MRGAGGVLVIAVAAIIACCGADSHQESDMSAGESPGEHYDAGHKAVSMDHPGGALVRSARDTGFVPYLMTRKFDNSPFGKREPWPAAPARGGYYPEFPKRNFDEIDRSGLDQFVIKRNFDEIDRSGLDQFVIKRNFDEIDQTSMPFPYATKRFYHLYGPNRFEIDMPLSSFDKKRYRPDYPMDEIDLSHFPIGSKRSQDAFRPTR
ncbi:orcokinin peptides-like isoform X2 [Ostrinia nubilalis]|uniref:orcokinin peptides-like isoform X2 n=2 Tax=Ostrinia nubilalis TaxID=29057 RepID=UPI0030822FCD